MNTLVSVIVTTYKRPLGLVQRAVDSVIRQTWKSIEIIVVDDNTDDDMLTLDLKRIEQLYPDQNLRYVSYKGNHGACYARNYGLNLASGKYIAYLDDDDEWIPEKIEKQVKQIENSGAALIYCSALVKNDTTGELSHGNKCKYKGWVYQDLIMENFIGSTSFPLLDKESAIKVGGFDINMQSAQDYDLWLRLCKEYKIDYVNEELGIYHVHSGEQITKNPEKKISGLSRLNQKNQEYLNQNKKALWYRTIKLAPFYAQKGELRKGLDVWIKSIKICPLELKANVKYLIYIFRHYEYFRKDKKNKDS